MDFAHIAIVGCLYHNPLVKQLIPLSIYLHVVIEKLPTFGYLRMYVYTYHIHDDCATKYKIIAYVLATCLYVIIGYVHLYVCDYWLHIYISTKHIMHIQANVYI